MTPLRFCGGMGGAVVSLLCCAVPVFGRHKWRPYVFAAGWGAVVSLLCLRRSGVRAS